LSAKCCILSKQLCHMHQSARKESTRAAVPQKRARHDNATLIPPQYRLEGIEGSYLCKPCRKYMSSTDAVLKHDKAKHWIMLPTLQRLCDYCGGVPKTPFAWLDHRGDCSLVPKEIRDKINLTGVRCIVDPEHCSFQCLGIGIFMHLNDQHFINLSRFEEDFVETFQALGLVEILGEEDKQKLLQNV